MTDKARILDAYTPSTRACLDVLTAVVEAVVAGAPGDVYHLTSGAADHLLNDLSERFDRPPGDPVEKEIAHAFGLVWRIRDLAPQGVRRPDGTRNTDGDDEMRATIAALRAYLGASV